MRSEVPLARKSAGSYLQIPAFILWAAALAGAASAIPDSFLWGFAPAAAAVLAAFILHRTDLIPDRGTVFFIAALVTFAVQIWGGGFGPAVFLYPVLFLWMKRESVAGQLLAAASIIAGVEFLAPLVSASGITGGALKPEMIIEAMFNAVLAGLIPLLSMAAVEALHEERGRDIMGPAQPEACSEPAGAFPDDVARSLIPILVKATCARGIFLFVVDERGVFTLNEHMADECVVAPRYMTGPDDPLVRLLESSPGGLVHSTAVRIFSGLSGRLPWYVRPPAESGVISVVQFRQDGQLKGFMVFDYQSEEARKEAASVLVDASFLVSVSWERCAERGENGFLDLCRDISAMGDIRAGIHRLVLRTVESFSGATATVAILGENGRLCIFESIGPVSEGRAGRDFGLEEGFAGLAVRRREPLRRLRMGGGRRAARTFSDSDDPDGRVGSCCAIPLEDSGTVFGVLTVESTSEQFFSPSDVSLLSAFAAVFCLAAGRRQMESRLEKLRENDRVTGLPLLSSFHENLSDKVRDVRNRAVSITVLAVDIHDFSSVNRAFGYSAGDLVLEKAARRIERAVGKGAILSRVGGDCFLVCLHGVDRVSAEAYASRIHEEFAGTPFNVSGTEKSLSVVIGGAVSHVDRMIGRLPDIAVRMASSIEGKAGMTSVTEVGQFYDAQR
jgi:diguanylate cyclase (GGDEF)-like protein